MSKNRIAFTEGNIPKLLLQFSLPILLADVFQQIYNITNSYIAGNIISTEALSAISSCDAIINIFGLIFHGIGIGCSILVATYYGAGKKEELNKGIETSIIFCIGFGLVLTIIGEIGTSFLLSINNIKDVIMPLAKDYLRIYLLGNTSILTYDVCFYMMRSLGDSKHPLLYLIASAFLNLGLGYFLVAGFNMGVKGVALATIISQTIVCILCMRKLLKMMEIKVDIKDFDVSMMKTVLSLGIPQAIQNSLLGISTMMVSSYTNLFSVETIAGIGVANKIYSWGHIPISAINTASTTFVGQNMGAEKYDRVKEEIKIAILFGMISSAIIGGAICLFAPEIVSLFDKNPIVIKHGSEMLYFTMFSLVFTSASHIYNGACRGAGNMKIPLYISVATQTLFRYLFVVIYMQFDFNVLGIYLSQSLSWSLSGILATIYFNTSKWTLEKHMR